MTPPNDRGGKFSKRWYLPPNPDLEFHPEIHRYRYKGRWIGSSITKVINLKTEYEMKRIEEHRSTWEPRGKTVHKAFQNFWETGQPGEMGKYGKWITPLVEFLDGWKDLRAVAVEYSMVDPRYNIAGQLDALLVHRNGDFILADLKTLEENGKMRNISPQLGGYLNLLEISFPGIEIARCVGVWSWPGRVKLKSWEPDDCRQAYLALRQAHNRNCEEF